MGSVVWLSGEGGFDSGDEFGVVGWGVGGEAGEDGAISSHEEFLEVPEEFGEGVGAGESVSGREFCDAFPPGPVDDVGGLGFDERGVERVLVGAGDGGLGEEREGDWIVDGAKLGDFFVRAGLLRAEVVGGEAEDGEAARLVALIEGFERGVLWSEAALAGDIHDEQDLVGEGREAGGLAGEGGEGDGGNGHGDSLVIAWRKKSVEILYLRA